MLDLTLLKDGNSKHEFEELPKENKILERPSKTIEV